MRAGKIAVLAALVGALVAAPAQAAPHFVVGQGENPGVAVDAAGTAYIGWQINTHADAGDAVQLCVLPAGGGGGRRGAPARGGPAVLRRPLAPGRPAPYVRHWTGAAWPPPVTIGP